MTESDYNINLERRLKWKDYGYDNLLLMAVLALMTISLLIWLIKGVE